VLKIRFIFSREKQLKINDFLFLATFNWPVKIRGIIFGGFFLAMNSNTSLFLMARENHQK
jgi:hypothetical protein